jgi:uracil-DNA glycosylase family 4
MTACRPYLLGEIEAVRPKVLVALGGTALRALLGPGADLRDAHGKVFAFGRIALVATYHPAAILYNRDLRTIFQRDLLTAVRLSRRLHGNKQGPPRGRVPGRTPPSG